MATGDKIGLVLPINLKVYIDSNGNEPFTRWLKKQDKTTQHFVYTKLARVKQGKVVKVKAYGPICGIVLSYPTKIRLYCGLDADNTIMLLGGGADRQSKDIEKAKSHWQDYKKEKKAKK